MLPSALSVVIYALCLLSLNAPAYAVLFLVISCVLILWLYPIVYFTNNLINTKMDYRDYEKYLEESKILDFGVEDFLPLGITYKVKIVLLLACVVAAVLLTDVSWLYPSVMVLIAFLSIIDHLIMKRVLRNILLFIQGGEYSADIKKIFNTSDSSR